MMNLKSVKQMCKKKYVKCEKGKNTKLKGMSPDVFKLHAPFFINEQNPVTMRHPEA